MVREKDDGAKRRHFSKVLRMVKHPRFFFALLFLIATSPINATTWDVVVDFPGTANPNGVWSYGWTAQLGSAFDLFTHFHDSDTYYHSPLWNQPNNGNDAPGIWKNLGPSTGGVENGELSLHPGPDGEYTVARWTSPRAATITISGHFGAGGVGSMNYYIYQNGTEIFKVLDTRQRWSVLSGQSRPSRNHHRFRSGGTL